RVPRRSVDAGAHRRGHRARVRPPVLGFPDRAVAQGVGLDVAEACEAGQAARRPQGPALEGRGLASDQKKALSQGYTVVFVDESGFYLLPAVVRTWAPMGETPRLVHYHTKDHISAISGITLSGELYIAMQERAFNAADCVRFLKHLVRQIGGKVLVIWDG